MLVTDRDRVVAELVPPQPGRAERGSDALLADLVRTGALTPPLVADSRPPPSQPVAPLSSVIDELSRDRDSR